MPVLGTWQGGIPSMEPFDTAHWHRGPHLYLYLSISIYPSICLSVAPSVDRSIDLSIYIYIYIYVSISIYLYPYLSVFRHARMLHSCFECCVEDSFGCVWPAAVGLTFLRQIMLSGCRWPTGGVNFISEVMDLGPLNRPTTIDCLIPWFHLPAEGVHKSDMWITGFNEQSECLRVEKGACKNCKMSVSQDIAIGCKFAQIRIATLLVSVGFSCSPRFRFIVVTCW
jgi:hypothetical protein